MASAAWKGDDGAEPDDLARGLAELEARRLCFEAEHSRDLASADIQADATWSALFARVKAMEKEAARPPAAGGCEHFIARRRRYCTARAQMGEPFCSQHAADATSAARLLSGGSATTVVLGRRGGEAEAGAAPGEHGSTRAPTRRKTNLGRRMKAMSDPLCRQGPASQPPCWEDLLDAPVGPVLVDVGCAKGRFVQALAASSEAHQPRAVSGSAACSWLLSGARDGPDWRFVGLELFAPLAEAAQRWAYAREERNAAFAGANAALDGGAELLRVCAGLDVRVVCVQFPDPWGAHVRKVSGAEPGSRPGGDGSVEEEEARAASERFAKSKFRRRRLLGSPGVARAIGALLPAGGLAYCASDVLAVALEMRGALEACGGAFEEHALHAEPAWCAPAEGAPCRRTWLRRPPFGIPTERELVCELAWRPVYRFLLRRTALPLPPPADS